MIESRKALNFLRHGRDRALPIFLLRPSLNNFRNKKFFQKILIFFPKTLDKHSLLWYNKGTKNEGMYKVMKMIINGVRCDITEKTAVAVMFPHRPWCKTLAQAEFEEERDRRIEEDLWSIEDYDVFSDVYKSIYGILPRWISPEDLKRIQQSA